MRDTAGESIGLCLCGYVAKAKAKAKRRKEKEGGRQQEQETQAVASPTRIGWMGWRLDEERETRKSGHMLSFRQRYSVQADWIPPLSSSRCVQ